jgi:nitric oxide reductase NorQ protein
VTVDALSNPDAIEVVAGPGAAIASAGDAPFYLAVGNEVAVFEAAWRRGLAIMLRGPTGCGKTRFVEAMAHRLGRPLYTVPGHEDVTASDLVGRYVLRGGETVWVDGPLTRSVREGAICYLDEIVEARQDATVVIHPLADHRRELNLERLGVYREKAADGFGLVVSYNPGYQSVLKDLKISTRQRMVGIELDFPPPEIEEQVIVHESGLGLELIQDLVALGQAIRRLKGNGLREAASTRALIAAASLIAEGLPPRQAAIAAIAVPLTDDAAQLDGLVTMIDSYLTA